jgi:hypothetical protein
MDDLTEKINELLSNPESMEKIKNLAGMLGVGSDGGSNSGGSGSSGNSNNSGGLGNLGSLANLAGMLGMGGGGPAPPTKQENGGGLPFDPAMIMKLKSAFDLMNKDDPRVDLLLALKPNLSDLRQKKIDEAIQILRLLSLMPLLREQGIF